MMYINTIKPRFGTEFGEGNEFVLSQRELSQQQFDEMVQAALEACDDYDMNGVIARKVCEMFDLERGHEGESFDPYEVLATQQSR